MNTPHKIIWEDVLEDNCIYTVGTDTGNTTDEYKKVQFLADFSSETVLMFENSKFHERYCIPNAHIMVVSFHTE